jgi:hypothetical protein
MCPADSCAAGRLRKQKKTAFPASTKMAGVESPAHIGKRGRREMNAGAPHNSELQKQRGEEMRKETGE